MVDDLWHRDPYLVCADFEAYAAGQAEVGEVYRDHDEWTRRVIANLAGVGRFSSDRTIAEYARDIWNAEAVPVELSPPDPTSTVAAGGGASRRADPDGRAAAR